MYQNILVAIDDSETSAKALREAISIASACGIALHIAHAVDESLFPTHYRGGALLVDPAAAQRALEDEGRGVLDRAAGIARAAGVEAHTHLISSETRRTADQILQAVADAGADLVIVGSHGRRGVERLLLGSVAERVARKASVSVLIVRGD
jgi:nucleotide-binding universal stress UspA family protein